MRSGNLSRRHLLSDFRQAIRNIIISSAQQVGPWPCPWVSLEGKKRWSLSTQIPLLLLQNPLKTIKPSRSSLSICCCLLQSVLDRSPSANLRTVTVLSLGWRSGSSASYGTLFFLISTRRSRLSSWSWDCSNSRTHPATHVPICALALVYKVWGKRCKCRTA